MRRPLRLPKPANPLDPEIGRAMVTSELWIPPIDHFQGSFNEEEITKLQHLDEGHRKTLVALNVHGQWQDWNIQTTIDVHDAVRKLDAEVARLKIELSREREEQKEQRILWSTLRWLALTIGAGAAAAIGQSMISKF